VNLQSLRRATIVGTVLQLMMIIVGHFLPRVALNVFMVGGLAISAIAGVLYGRTVEAGYGVAALGGAVAGGVCAVIGIAVSLLRDTPMPILLYGTAGSAIAGAIGGAVGRASGRRRAAD
jgi:hypothetical protein